MTERKPPGTSGDEKTTLLGFLDYLRDAIAAKVDGVPEPQVRAPGVPSGTNLLGLVKHLTYVERYYFLGAEVRDWAATFTPTGDGTRVDWHWEMEPGGWLKPFAGPFMSFFGRAFQKDLDGLKAMMESGRL